MSINPVGIQSYQQTIRRDRPAAEPGFQGPETTGQAPANVKIEPQERGAESTIAVNPSSETFAENLSVDEKKAMELLFGRFRDVERFGPGYTAKATVADEKATLGKLVDLKA